MTDRIRSRSGSAGGRRVPELPLVDRRRITCSHLSPSTVYIKKYTVKQAPLAPSPSPKGEEQIPITRRIKGHCSKASDGVKDIRAMKRNGDDKNGTETKRNKSVESRRNHKSNQQHRSIDESKHFRYHTRSVCNPGQMPRGMAKPDQD